MPLGMTFKQTCFNVWKSNFDRKNIQSTFKPVFTRYIGMYDASEYNDILKTYYEKFSSNDRAVVFDNQIPMTPNFELISYVNKELQTMDIKDLKNQDITVFNNPEVNQIFLGALDYVVQKAIAQENFPNMSIRNNFIVKMILWAYLYLSKLTIDTEVAPKCFYYGNISKHEVYFLLMLHVMTFDVIYANPLKDDIELWNKVDTDRLCEVSTSSQIGSVDTLEQRISNAQVIEYVESTTLRLENEVADQLFSGTGFFKPWQFRYGTVKALFMNSSIIDLEQSWNAPAKVREGFRVEGQTVVVPNLFHRVDGEYTKTEDYSKLLNVCSSAPNTLVLHGSYEYNQMFDSFPSSEEGLQLSFCQRGDLSFDLEKLKDLPFYKYTKYRDELEDLILNKMNETIVHNQVFRQSLNKEQIFTFVLCVLSLSPKVIQLIDNFDFPEAIPKVVVFCEQQQELNETMMMALGYLSTLGLDIAIFSPAGIEGSNIISPGKLNSDRLEVMKYDRDWESYSKRRRILSKIFG